MQTGFNIQLAECRLLSMSPSSSDSFNCPKPTILVRKNAISNVREAFQFTGTLESPPIFRNDQQHMNNGTCAHAVDYRSGGKQIMAASLPQTPNNEVSSILWCDRAAALGVRHSCTSRVFDFSLMAWLSPMNLMPPAHMLTCCAYNCCRVREHQQAPAYSFSHGRQHIHE